MDEHPQADAEPAIVGTWRCVAHGAKATERPATITIKPKADRVYAVTFQEDGDDADHYESYASVVRDEKVFNTRDVSGHRKAWVFMRYVLLRPSVLQLELLNGDVLKEQDSPAKLRAAVESLHGRPDEFIEFCVCARARVDDEAQK
jgi:hypothetical protein